MCPRLYLAIAAAAPLLAAFPYYAPALPLAWQYLEPVANGLAGGAIAGSVAIAMYWIGRRSRSREKKFVAARALVAELERTLDVVHPSEPAPAGGRYERPDMPASTRTGRAAEPAPAGGSYERTGTGLWPHADPDLHAGQQGIRPPGVPRRVYEGLVASGGMFHLELTLQVRLHAFYDHADRDDRGALAPMIVPLMLDVAGFRDANAPFAWLGLAWPPRRMLSGLRLSRRQ